VHGLPDVLYTDHASDYLAVVTADLHIELVPRLPGQLVRGHPMPSAWLSGPAADAALGREITAIYHQRFRGQTGQAPHWAWLANG
jgi:hypothetical protein